MCRQPLNELLQVSQKHNIDIPKDSKTLLKTPRSVEQVVTKCGGSYHYSGIEKGVARNLKRSKQNPSYVKLSVNHVNR